jgi:hypothetical protein
VAKENGEIYKKGGRNLEGRRRRMKIQLWKEE